MSGCWPCARVLRPCESARGCDPRSPGAMGAGRARAGFAGTASRGRGELVFSRALSLRRDGGRSQSRYGAAGERIPSESESGVGGGREACEDILRAEGEDRKAMSFFMLPLCYRSRYPPHPLLFLLPPPRLCPQKRGPKHPYLARPSASIGSTRARSRGATLGPPVDSSVCVAPLLG